MLTVVVGVVLLSGAMLKKFMPTMFDDIAQKILHAADGLGQGQG